jgi:hypothetical protein
LPQACACSKNDLTAWPRTPFAAKFILVRYVAMSLEWITAGVLVCIFAIIALMPSFDGKWE